MPGDVASVLAFPIALAALAVMAWSYARWRRARLEAVPAPDLKRHQQVIRAVPDPDALPLERALARWVESGEEPDRAVDVLSSAAGTSQAAAVRAATTKRKRESLIALIMERQGAEDR